MELSPLASQYWKVSFVSLGGTAGQRSTSFLSLLNKVQTQNRSNKLRLRQPSQNQSSSAIPTSKEVRKFDVIILPSTTLFSLVQWSYPGLHRGKRFDKAHLKVRTATTEQGHQEIRSDTCIAHVELRSEEGNFLLHPECTLNCEELWTMDTDVPIRIIGQVQNIDEVLRIFRSTQSRLYEISSIRNPSSEETRHVNRGLQEDVASASPTFKYFNINPNLKPSAMSLGHFRRYSLLGE
ncbi:hypothetical protein M406DRAFT_331100 [Cryphonectria parasitica EP155]|uniref:Uncharacterized protein n=1 Tax=Cryphonectria parasitica (strain ATCC 38755 / EP155) TaxID=660469 RepID=A0A9P5CMV2_CRYP1|nr:uncharacterized protein M406DRAFT_331100 [Cryphonectria parasitica EP155]KAF3764779.1 hypothetical protein M406DRAFT_331100 [Cryphonectria parasitica EP155]